MLPHNVAVEMLTLVEDNFTPLHILNADKPPKVASRELRSLNEGSGAFECALATVTLPLINLLCYIQQTSKAGLRYIKSAV